MSSSVILLRAAFSFFQVSGSVLHPVQDHLELKLDGVVDLIDTDNLHQHDGDPNRDRDNGTIQGGLGRDGRHPLVVAVLQHEQPATHLVRLVRTVRELVAPTT